MLTVDAFKWSPADHLQCTYEEIRSFRKLAEDRIALRQKAMKAGLWIS